MLVRVHFGPYQSSLIFFDLKTTTMMKVNRKEAINNNLLELKTMLPNLVRIAILILGLVLLKPQGLISIMTYLLVMYCYDTAKDILKFKSWITNLIKYTVFMLVIYTLAYVSMGYGIIGLILFVITISCIKLFGSKQSRLKYKEGMQKIEKMMFGKTLDKDQWIDEKPGIKIKFKR